MRKRDFLIGAASAATLLAGASNRHALAAGGSEGDAKAAEPPLIYTHELGKATTVSLLSEGQAEGKAEVLINAEPDVLKKYVPTGIYATAYNTFLVRSPERKVLIDTGFGRKLFDNLATLKIKPEEIDAVLLTHMHGDHIGGLLRDGAPAFPKAALYVAEKEAAYWTSESAAQAVPENRRGGFIAAKAALAAYGNRVQRFQPAEFGASDAKPLLPGITALAAFGHTPGHTVYLVDSGAGKLLVWADIVHAAAIQIPVPTVGVTYDVDPREAVTARQRILDYVARNKLAVAGMHLPFPAMGHAMKEGNGYDFIPLKI